MSGPIGPGSSSSLPAAHASATRASSVARSQGGRAKDEDDADGFDLPFAKTVRTVLRRWIGTASPSGSRGQSAPDHVEEDPFHNRVITALQLPVTTLPLPGFTHARDQQSQADMHNVGRIQHAADRLAVLQAGAYKGRSESAHAEYEIASHAVAANDDFDNEGAGRLNKAGVVRGVKPVSKNPMEKNQADVEGAVQRNRFFGLVLSVTLLAGMAIVILILLLSSGLLQFQSSGRQDEQGRDTSGQGQRVPHARR